jgi:membrane protein DedA with SNARE-associated domain
MPFWRFTLLTLIGCIPWVLMLALAGRAVGDNWEDLQHNLHYVDYALALAIIGGVVALVVRHRRRRRRLGMAISPAVADEGGES